MHTVRPCGHAALYRPPKPYKIAPTPMKIHRWDTTGRDVTDLPGLWSSDDIEVCQTNYAHPTITSGQHTNGPAMIWTRTDSDDDWICTGETHLHRVREQWIAGHQLGKEIAMEETDRMLKWFAFTHLPEKLQSVSAPFGDLANHICRTVDPGPERTVALRKLLEAKDAAVRAVVQPGG